MENEKKLKQPVQQPLSGEKQRAFNKMAMLKKAAEEARTREEVEEAKRQLNGKVIWRKPQ